MITKQQTSDAIRYLDSFELESFVELGGDQSQLLVPKKLATQVVLEAFSVGMRRKLSRRKFRKYCTAKCRKEVGFSIDLWFLIGRVMIEIIPLLWKFWQSRRSHEGQVR